MTTSGQRDDESLLVGSEGAVCSSAMLVEVVEADTVPVKHQTRFYIVLLRVLPMHGSTQTNHMYAHHSTAEKFGGCTDYDNCHSYFSQLEKLKR